MTDLTGHNPRGRFTGLAELYARCRPDYPAAAIDWIVARCGLGPGSLLVDVGCGTGISARQLAARGIPVIGVEPNADMRRQAEAAGGPPHLRYHPGTAEATGLPDGVADTVLAAQAFHWFDAPAALAEFHRLLRPDGWAVLVWNERNERDPATAAYGAVLTSAPGASTIESERFRAGRALLESPLYQDGEVRAFAHSQPLDDDGLVGRAFSASYAPREAPHAEAFEKALRDVFARYQRDGVFDLRYVTTVYLARRR
ncbi:MAG: class I SAM-dependent methyltransferase [Gemmataceae bacterium]